MKNINFKDTLEYIIESIRYNFKLKLFSLVFGFFTWVLVIGAVNPVVTRSFENIPIKFTNQNALEHNKLILVESSINSVNVVVKGSRNDVVALNRNDIIAQANLDEFLGSGTHKLNINITNLENIKIDSVSDKSVLVTLDKEITKDFDIVVETIGKLRNTNQVVTTKEPSDKKVSITGAVSVINQIKKVVSVVDISTMDKDEVVSSKIYIYDDKGKEIKNIKLSIEDTNVSIAFQHYKEVPIELVTLNTTDKDIRILKSDVVPNVISIVGNVDKLDSITSIKTKPLDLTQIKESGSYPILIDLPKDVSIVNTASKISVNIDVDKKIEKTLNVNKVDLSIMENSDSSLLGNIPDSIEVTLSGYETVLSRLTSSNVHLFLNLKKIIGESDVKIEMEPISDVELVKIKPATIKVK